MIATTDTAIDELKWHRMINDSGWTGGRVIPTYRPDTIQLVFSTTKGWTAALANLRGKEYVFVCAGTYAESLRIVDTHVASLIAAAFLFQFGTGPVQGFAVTLIIGIAASMITAVFVTRTFFMIWLNRRPAMATLSI